MYAEDMREIIHIMEYLSEVLLLNMQHNLQILPINIADHYDTVFRLLEHLHVHELHLFDKTATWDDIGAGYMRHVIKMHEENDGLCLMAYIDNVPVGLIFGYTEDDDEDSRIEVYKGMVLYVSDGVVLEEYRKSGIYTQLNRRMEQHYIDKGVKRIIRFTLHNNTRMQNFLEKEGYRITRLQYEKWL